MKYGRDIEVGDDLLFTGRLHRITDIKDYVHPVVTKGETWRTAYARRPGEVTLTDGTWGITLEPDQSYEVREGDGQDG